MCVAAAPFVHTVCVTAAPSVHTVFVEQDFPSMPVTGSSDAEFAAAVGAKIFEGENALHLSLAAMYVNMSEETLKSMRRVMPITRTKFEWNNAAHSMVKNLKTKEGAA